ncbi:hypothetical protein WDU94_000658 [Cyamophila willieti]
MYPYLFTKHLWLGCLTQESRRMAAYEFCNVNRLVQKVQLMLNNEEHSDTVFLVNNARYHAWSHLVAMYSTVLKSLMNEYFAHCEDREIKVRNVKHEDSFYLLLKYMYGVKINFTETNMNVICEALSLAERFEVADFSKELKQFVSSRIDGFDIETVVSLLNTSRKFNLDDLYKKVTEYAYKNAEHLVKHASFVELQYEVLVDLLKSDWFCTKEIEILTSVLTWHDDMDVKRRGIDLHETIYFESETGPITDEQDHVEGTNTLSVNENQSDISGLGSKRLDGNNRDNENPTSNKAEDLNNLRQLFQKNVLKSLLSNIRHLRFLAFEYMKALESDLFVKYKDVLADCNHFSQSAEPRKKYVSSTISTNPVSKTLVSKIFKISRFRRNTVYESNEELQIGNFKLKIDLKESLKNYAYFDIHLICTSDGEDDWEFYTEAQVIWKPYCNADYYGCKEEGCVKGVMCKDRTYWLYLPTENIPGKFSLCSSQPRQYIGQYKLNLSNALAYNRFIVNNTIQLDVLLKTFQIKK